MMNLKVVLTTIMMTVGLMVNAQFNIVTNYTQEYLMEDGRAGEDLGGLYEKVQFKIDFELDNILMEVGGDVYSFKILSVNTSTDILYINCDNITLGIPTLQEIIYMNIKGDNKIFTLNIAKTWED